MKKEIAMRISEFFLFPLRFLAKILKFSIIIMNINLIVCTLGEWTRRGILMNSRANSTKTWGEKNTIIVLVYWDVCHFNGKGRTTEVAESAITTRRWGGVAAFGALMHYWTSANRRCHPRTQLVDFDINNWLNINNWWDKNVNKKKK